MTVIRTTVVALIIAFVVGPGPADAQEMGGMEMGEGYVPDSLSRAQLAPLVKGYYEGGDAFFIHTEASDAKIARTLTKMMGPKVVVAPELADAPASLTAPIYVFDNGPEGMGPLGHQPDILGAVPGDEGYSPLHRIHLVSWNESATPRELTSEEALMQARQQGQLTIEASGIVVNAPVLAGPKGHCGSMAGM
jgi:hypothetical protein